MFRIFFIIISLALSLVSIKSLAIEVNDLYRVVVTVDDQTPAQRKQAITTALQGVFLKVGGKKSVLQNNLLLRAIKKPNKYINKYRYQRKNDELSIVVSFNEDKVNELFKQADLSLWGSLRPQVLLWLIDEQGLRRHIVAYDEDTLIPNTINNFSTQRGLPILMPLMDLTDNEQVVLSDLWGYFPDEVQQASQRYFADTVIVMRVSDSSLVDYEDKQLAKTVNDNTCGIHCLENEIKTPKALDWKVYTQGALYIQRYKGDDKTALITQGLSDITELIYQTYALSTTANNDFVIEVDNVTSLKNDKHVFDFLTDLSGVNAVKLISAQGNVRRYQLDLASSQASFLSALKLNDKLTQQHTEQNSIPNMNAYGVENIVADGAYSTMKVIVLGVDESSEDQNHLQDVGKTVDGIESKMTDTKTSTDIDPVIEKPAPLTITPNVPVFYWEKG